MAKVTKQTSRNSRRNLSHTLAGNGTKQQTSKLAERNFTTAKLNILHHTTNERGIERNKVTREQKGRKRKNETGKPAKNGR